MDNNFIEERYKKSKTTVVILAIFYIIAFLIGSLLNIATVQSSHGYQCFDSIKKCVCNGSDNDCNAMKSKECKGEVADNKCTKKFVNDKLLATSN